MAAIQSRNTGLLAKLNTQIAPASIQKSATQEIDYGIIQIPPGISNGVAELVECYFAKYKEGTNKDQPYFRAVGIVISPEEIDTPQGIMRVAGLQTSIMIPCCDMKSQDGKVTTANEFITGFTQAGEYTMERKSFVMNELKKLGGDTFLHGISKPEDLEDKAALLISIKPPIRFKFTTSLRKAMVNKVTGAKKGEDGVWQNWHGFISDSLSAPVSQSGFNSPMTVDNTAAKDQSPPNNPATQTTVSPDGAEEDLDYLIKQAMNNDEDAALKIQERALAVGLTEEAITSANTYEELGDMIKGTMSPGEEESSSTVLFPFPVGSSCKWNRTVIDTVTKKPKQAKVDVEVLTNDGTVVTLKGKLTKKTVVGIDGKTPMQVKITDLSET